MPGGKIRVTIYTLVLYGALAHNVFLIPTGLFWSTIAWQHRAIGYDSGLVFNRLVGEDRVSQPLAPLLIYWPERETTDWYVSQFGLQGVTLAAIHQYLGTEFDHFVVLAANGFALLTALTLALFFLELSRCVGPMAGNVGVAATVLMPILLPFATSLYWATFLLFAPFVWSWWVYPRAIGHRQRILGWLLGISLLILCKCLCGYEYVSTIVLSPAVAVVYHGVRESLPLRTWLRHATVAVLAGVAGFALALALHVWQLNEVVGVDGVAAILDRASHRTGVADQAREVRYPFAAPDPVFLPERWRLPVRCFANYFWLPTFATPASIAMPPREFTLGQATILLGVLAGLVGMTWWRWPLSVSALVPALGLGFAASISWQMLAINHMCVHVHLNQIVFIVPFLLLGVALLGGILQVVADRFKISRQADVLALLLLSVILVANVATMAVRLRTVEQRQKAAEQAVRVFLNQGKTIPTVGFPFSVDSLTSQRWPPYPGLLQPEERRLRREVLGQPEPSTVLLGWIYQPPRRRKQMLAATVSLVVVRGKQVVKAEVQRFRRPDVELLIAGKRVLPEAGFRIIVPESESEHVPFRVFAVDQDQQVWELPLPARSPAGAGSEGQSSTE